MKNIIKTHRESENSTEVSKEAKQVMVLLGQLESNDFNSNKLVKKVEEGLSPYSDLLVKSISEIGNRSSCYKIEAETRFGLNGYKTTLYYTDLDKTNSPKEKFSPYIEVRSRDTNDYSCSITLNVKLQNGKVEASFTDTTEDLATYSANVKTVKFILGRGLEMLLEELASELKTLVI